MEDLFANIYELFGNLYFEDFSDDLFRVGVYPVIGFLMLGLSLLGPVIYYYVINHPKFSKWWHWLIVIAVFAIINFTIATVYTFNSLDVLYYHDNPFFSEHFAFGMMNALWSMVFSFVFSMCIKWGSRNCKHSPISLIKDKRQK